MKTCPRCGETNQDEAVACVRCGEPLRVRPGRAEREQSRRFVGALLKSVLLGLLVALVLIGIFAVAIIHYAPASQVERYLLVGAPMGFIIGTLVARWAAGRAKRQAQAAQESVTED